ncbi:MAG: menaquinone biosynthesis protein [Deltaproteobacteria bacterium]|jgi:chorismate dehydratase|nr:menaquinone biosynthesis protein [Deltaproteobacteria bacterium]MBW2518771.1 menaquinone biosynthesis protein [Deltaproteobacteria bacterium]
MPLKVGCIAYLNILPYFYYLKEAGFEGEVVSGVPSELNRMLSSGEIDACPSSSFEYGLNAKQYLLLPGFSISSMGSVQSVLFFQHETHRSARHKSIALTGESATSINLLKVLLYELEFFAADEVSFEIPQGAVEDALLNGQDALLIGDRALHIAKQKPKGVRIFDLGLLWYQLTGLPFVFALWILRRQSVREDPEAFRKFKDTLSLSFRLAFDNLEVLAKSSVGQTICDQSELVRYWQNISYDLTDLHLKGLKLFFQLCKKYELLNDVPEFHFFDSSVV